jgi:hypothetical protein
VSIEKVTPANATEADSSGKRRAAASGTDLMNPRFGKKMCRGKFLPYFFTKVQL